MIRRHLTPALIVFVVLLVLCLGHPPAWRWWVILAALSAAAAAIPLLRTSSTMRRAGLCVMSLSVGLMLGAISLARMENVSQGSYLPFTESRVSGFAGYLTQDSGLAEKGETILRVALREASSAAKGVTAQARGSVLVFLSGDYRFSLGERLSFQANPSELDSFGPERYVARVERADVRSEGFSSGAWAFRAKAREWLHRAVARIGYPASALLEALLIGSREDVPARLYDGFKQTGSLHILALSGLHVTVIYGIIAGLLGFLRSRGVRYLLATVVLLFYQFIAGFMPSLLRATVMILVGGTALLLDRDAEPVNLLALSGIAILLIDPFQAYSLSFQLSFLAMGGIFALGPLVQRPLEGRLPRFMLVPLAMSAGAQAATLPLVLARFGAYYPSGLAAGLLLVPLTTALLWAGIAWLPVFLVPWPMLHDLCSRVFAGLYEVIDHCAQFFAQVPGISAGPAVAPWVAGGAAALMICLGLLLPARSRVPAMEGK